MSSEAVKRILKEYNGIRTNPSDDFVCRMLEHDPFEWFYAFRGCRGTEFERGIYHGHLRFSKYYPSEPPSIKLLTENGRFKIKTEIGLNWQPEWGVREAILELSRSMDTYPDGKLGSVKYDKEKRLTLAMKAFQEAPEYGTAEHQKLIDENHKDMLSKAHPLRVPPQLSRVHEHSQNDGANRNHGTGGGSVGNNNVIGNIFLAANANGVGVSGSMNDCSGEGPNPKKQRRSWFW
ncbi:ubiquitin-conjugating enzyme E2 32-like [Prunus avium]|uniref:Ubiquitin-conjugating enzyme E2 32-like n=1 Tax=Prunus avium TaxID=42229 RepID=A0A6P5SD82_PRUAV|nr:ubiquitin-conjugating enzyme E2 32-like [Prunus avium]